MESLASENKYEAIRELIHRAAVFSQAQDREKIEEAVIDRERVYSTGLGRGVAIAHGATPAVKETLIALGISRRGIDFNSIDRSPVHLLFVIAHPPDKQVEYLAALATVTRLMRDESFRQSIFTSGSGREVEAVICKAFHTCLEKYHKNAV